MIYINAHWLIFYLEHTWANMLTTLWEYMNRTRVKSMLYATYQSSHSWSILQKLRYKQLAEQHFSFVVYQSHSQQMSTDTNEHPLTTLGAVADEVPTKRIAMLHKPSHLDIDGLMQERCNSSALAMQLHLSCINPSTYLWMFSYYSAITLQHPIFFKRETIDIASLAGVVRGVFQGCKVWWI